MQIKDHDILKMPNPILTRPNGKNQNKYCQYHNDFGYKLKISFEKINLKSLFKS